MRILICGDRNWTNQDLIYKELEGYKLDPKVTTIIHGACRGADRLAGRAARCLGLDVKEFPADWKKYGNAAGPIRNTQMLDEKPNLVLAFHNDIENSKGTKDMVKKARKAGVITFVVTDTGEAG